MFLPVTECAGLTAGRCTLSERPTHTYDETCTPTHTHRESERPITRSHGQRGTPRWRPAQRGCGTAYSAQQCVCRVLKKRTSEKKSLSNLGNAWCVVSRAAGKGRGWGTVRASNTRTEGNKQATLDERRGNRRRHSHSDASISAYEADSCVLHARAQCERGEGSGEAQAMPLLCSSVSLLFLDLCAGAWAPV